MSLSVVEAAPVVEAAEPVVEAEEPAKKKKKRKSVAAAPVAEAPEPVVEAPAPGYYLHLSNITNLILFIILQVIRT